MARSQYDQTHDTALLFKDAGLVAADGAATVSAAAAIIDLGLARANLRLLIDVSAIEVATGDESYRIKFQVSNSSSFASGVIGGPQFHLGDSTVLIGESADSVIGQYEMTVTNEINGTLYRYARIYTDVAGTIATGINYTVRGVIVN